MYMRKAYIEVFDKKDDIVPSYGYRWPANYR